MCLFVIYSRIFSPPLDDLRPLIEPRPAGRHALKLAPNCPGRIPPVSADEWLRSVRKQA